MPTGYTAAIGDGATFEEFAWSCARNFGALITMRDAPHDAPVPEAFEPSDYYAKRLREIEAERDKILGATNEEICTLATEARAKVEADNNARIVKNRELRKKYEAMLAKVDAWDPPTSDHAGMKDFMRQQIADSIKFDCGSSYQEELPPADPAIYRKGLLEKYESDLAYYSGEWEKEKERTKKRNEWISALRASIPQPIKAAA